jgi:dTDP-4-amino-4,6-dideoxygalactose transaminase
MKPIPYGRQQITEDDKQAVISALESDFLTQGPMVDEFEKNFSQFVGATYAVAVTNGTAALHLSAIAHGVKHGDKVLVTPISFDKIKIFYNKKT